MATLAKHKSLLTQSQQREFEAYIEVKKSVETVEQAQLEKAEVQCLILFSCVYFKPGNACTVNLSDLILSQS